jgi:hypothetical protein
MLSCNSGVKQAALTGILIAVIAKGIALKESRPCFQLQEAEAYDEYKERPC